VLQRVHCLCTILPPRHRSGNASQYVVWQWWSTTETETTSLLSTHQMRNVQRPAAVCCPVPLSTVTSTAHTAQMRNVEIHHGRPKDVEALLAEYVNYAHKVLQWYCSGTAVVLQWYCSGTGAAVVPTPIIVLLRLLLWHTSILNSHASITITRHASIATPQSPRLNRHTSITTPQ
jgi:hypothetical protein